MRNKSRYCFMDGDPNEMRKASFEIDVTGRSWVFLRDNKNIVRKTISISSKEIGIYANGFNSDRIYTWSLLPLGPFMGYLSFEEFVEKFFSASNSYKKSLERRS